MRRSFECKNCGGKVPFDESDPMDTDATCPVCGAVHTFNAFGKFLGFRNQNVQDPVNHPSHYTSGPIECFDAMKSAFTKEEMIAYCKVAAFKYLWREGKKDNPIQERKKAEWYLQKSIELMENPK